MKPDFRTDEREGDAVELREWLLLMADYYTAHEGRDPTPTQRTTIAAEAQALAAAERAIDAMA